MAEKKIHLGESFLDRLIKDTYNKNSLGDLSTEQMNALDAYMKSDDFKTKSLNFRSTDRTKFEGSVDHSLGKDTEKSRFYLNSLANPDTTKYIIPTLQPKLATSGMGTSARSAGTATSNATVLTGAGTSSATALATSTNTETTVDAEEQPATPQFTLDSFAADNNLEDFKVINGKKYVRYDPTGFGDFYIGEDGKIYDAAVGGGLGSEITSSIHTSGTRQRRLLYNKLLQLLSKYKIGGTMKRINYFEKGGLTQNQQAKAQEEAFMRALLQGDPAAAQQLVQVAIQDPKSSAAQLIQSVLTEEKRGNTEVSRAAQAIKQAIQQVKGQATSAKWGSKLGYIRSLKYAKGGRACPACEKGAPVKIEEKACGGKAKKAKKRYFGGWL